MSFLYSRTTRKSSRTPSRASATSASALQISADEIRVTKYTSFDRASGCARGNSWKYQKTLKNTLKCVYEVCG